jgi:sulfane dehydrogenase subunit SoxC
MDSKDKETKVKQASRRRFLTQGAALAGLAAVGGMRSVHAQVSEASPRPPDETGFDVYYGVRSHFETSVRERIPGQEVFMQGSLTPHQDSMGIITPSGLHYTNVRFHQNPPAIDPRQHHLLIHGLVDRPLIFTMEELKRLPSVSRFHFIECTSNTSGIGTSAAQGGGGFHNGFRTVQESHGKLSNSQWTGVLLSTLLREAGVKKDGTWIISESADAGHHTQPLPIEKAMDDCLVAYGQNGEAVRPENGYPVRLVVPGSIGINNVKHLRRIKVVDEFYKFRWSYGGRLANVGGKTVWTGFVKPVKSVITHPSGGMRVPSPGFFEIRGLAWSGAGTIRRVEVSTDGGQTWKDAQLEDPVLPKACTRFTFPWTWNGQEIMIQSRATDDKGVIQQTFAEYTANSGSQNGFIYPWKVTREGSVENALPVPA